MIDEFRLNFIVKTKQNVPYCPEQFEIEFLLQM